MGSLLDLLESAKVIHPVQLGLFLVQVVAADQDVALERRLAECLGHF